jgi:hypothetical protein
MSIFNLLGPGRWQPSPLAAGPFKGLQGGAIAGLLTAELEALAADNGWGSAVSVTVWFLRPTPMATLRTQATCLVEGGRVNIVDNMLYVESEATPCATARVTFIRERPLPIPEVAATPWPSIDPAQLPPRSTKAPHGKPWFMDAMEARGGDGTTWFRLSHSLIDGAGAPTSGLAPVLGPADWTHGLARPLQGVAIDPNPNLTVQLFRKPRGEWIGVRARAWWRPDRGLGAGSGVLLDTIGEIGCVSMAVALLPWPKSAG